MSVSPQPRVALAPFRTSPSAIACYFFHDCERFLRFRSASPETRAAEGLPAPEFDHSPLVKAVLESGHLWEQTVLEKYLGQRALIAPGDGELPTRRFDWSQTLRLLREAESGTFIYQPTLRLPRGFYDRYGLDPELVVISDNHPDLIAITDDGHGRRLLRVLDLKRGEALHLTHRVQVLLYALELEAILWAETLDGLHADVQWGEVWLGAQASATPFELADLRPHLENFLRHDLMRILRGAADEAHWHVHFRCEWCEFFDHCRSEMQRDNDLSRLSQLTSYGKQFLRSEAHVRTVPELGEFLQRPGADELLARCASLAGRRPRLTQQVAALETNRPQTHGAAAPSLSKGENVGLFLTLQQEPLGQSVYLAGMHLTVRKDLRQELFSAGVAARFFQDQGSPPLVLLARDPADVTRIRREWVQVLYEVITQVDRYNQGRSWSDQLSLQAYVLTEHERALLIAWLLESLQDAGEEVGPGCRTRPGVAGVPGNGTGTGHPCPGASPISGAGASGPAGPLGPASDDERPTLAEQAMALLFHFQAPELMVADSHPDREVPFPVVVLLDALGHVLALPIEVSYTLPEALEALGSRFRYRRNDYFHFPLGHGLRAEAIHAAWYRGRTELLPEIEDQARALLRAQRELLQGMRQQAADAIFAWAAKFSLPTRGNYPDPLLSRLAFFARYESLLACLSGRHARCEPQAVQLLLGKVMELRAIDAAEFEIVSGAALPVQPGGFPEWLLVSDDEAGRKAQLEYRDYACRSRLWQGKPQTQLAVVGVASIQRDKHGTPSRLTVEYAKPFAEEAPQPGQRFLLYPRFTDYTTDGVVAFLQNYRSVMDRAGQDELFLRLLRDPASVCRPQPGASPLAGTSADAGPTETLIDQLQLTASQAEAFRAIFQRRVVPVWGPPGTGKTHFLASMILGLAAAQARAGRPFRVLVTAFTHAAIENLLRKVIALRQALRIGPERPSTSHVAASLRDADAGLGETGPRGVDTAVLQVAKVKSWQGSDQGPIEVIEPARLPHWLAGQDLAVVGATVHSLLKTYDELPEFDLVVIDEASQVRVPEAAVPISLAGRAGRLVLAGDHLQLPPIINGVYPEPLPGQPLLHRSIFEVVAGQQEAALREGDTKHNSLAPVLRETAEKVWTGGGSRSREPSGTGVGTVHPVPLGSRHLLFQQSLRGEGRNSTPGGSPEADPACQPEATWLAAEHREDYARSARVANPAHGTVQQLTENFRMNDVLTSFAAGLLYGPNYRPVDDTVASRRLDLVPERCLDPFVEACLDPASPLVVVVLDGIWAARENPLEARLVAKLVTGLRGTLRSAAGKLYTDDHRFFRAGVFLVSPHRAQIRLIDRELRQQRMWQSAPFVDTVDKMQGQEADAVIVSYGVSDPEFAVQEAEFIYGLNRLNVAVTRARAKCVVFLSRPLLDASLQVLEQPEAIRGMAFMRDLVAAVARCGEHQSFGLDDGARADVYRAAACFQPPAPASDASFAADARLRELIDDTLPDTSPTRKRGKSRRKAQTPQPPDPLEHNEEPTPSPRYSGERVGVRGETANAELGSPPFVGPASAPSPTREEVCPTATVQTTDRRSFSIPPAADPVTASLPHSTIPSTRPRSASDIPAVLAKLNDQQREAALHGEAPLLIIAGAGTGKTTTLVHRVAYLISQGVPPQRILLLTFTRRAAAEMLYRVAAVLQQQDVSRHVWGGTFHGVGARLLRWQGAQIGVDPRFSIHDRGDSEALLQSVCRSLDLALGDKKFPKKRTCMSIHSYMVNAELSLQETLETHFQTYAQYAEALGRLFAAYADQKTLLNVFDYDDLLRKWCELLEHQAVGRQIRARFDCVLVDEYQDTNRLQSRLLHGLCPDGRGLTVVGDDAQSIYSFRAATVRNILDFPQEFSGTRVVTLEQNYRSTPPILAASNCVMAEAAERFTKELWSQRAAGPPPQLITCEDEHQQVDFVVQRILDHRRRGVPLSQQAVLFRSAHHSILLEAELARQDLPFVKYGGLKFVEAAHVKDLLSFLRLAENPRDRVAGQRLLTLLPGIGPKKAEQLHQALLDSGSGFAAWADVKPPAKAVEEWPQLVSLLQHLADAASAGDLATQMRSVLAFYEPLMEGRYENLPQRLTDLEQLQQLAVRFEDRATLLAELALDPPDEAAEPEASGGDRLVLSTLHSAKGLEWRIVYVLHATDGKIPHERSFDDAEQLAEERRMFYVAMTRAADWLYVCQPRRESSSYGNSWLGNVYEQTTLTRFISKSAQREFQCQSASTFTLPAEAESPSPTPKPRRKTKRSGARKH